VRTACRVLVEKSEEKRRIGRARRSLKNNIKMDVKEIRCKCVDWINLPLYRK
jgi:hypothetical protein